MKAMERQVTFRLAVTTRLSGPRLDDVEMKLASTEKEADKARRDSKNARDQFNDVKRRR